MIVSSKVPLHVRDRNIVDYLAERFSYLPVAGWHERVAEGRILRNNEVCAPGQNVSGGDSISYDMPEWLEPPADLRYGIVHEDPWLLGIDKSGNLPVHRSGKSFKSNLIYQLRYVHEPAFPDAQIVNRLDRETSGVVLVAKEAATCARLHADFRERRVGKEYYAIVHGAPSPSAGTFDAPIGRAVNSAVTYRFCINGHAAKEAITRYECVRTIGRGFALLKLYPKTGRTHQIRVHCAAAGHGIVGDKLYGLSDEEFLRWRADPGLFVGRFLFHRQALHCAAMTFNHPSDKTECRIRAAMPEEMATLIARLESL
jgi:23S rRNA pseudouridine1911/1915/1917 synthase